jgi:hypothetical protein
LDNISDFFIELEDSEDIIFKEAIIQEDSLEFKFDLIGIDSIDINNQEYLSKLINVLNTIKSITSRWNLKFEVDLRNSNLLIIQELPQKIKDLLESFLPYNLGGLSYVDNSDIDVDSKFYLKYKENKFFLQVKIYKDKEDKSNKILQKIVDFLNELNIESQVIGEWENWDNRRSSGIWCRNTLKSITTYEEPI